MQPVFPNQPEYLGTPPPEDRAPQEAPQKEREAEKAARPAIRTYRTDVERYMERSGISLSDIAAKEALRRAAAGKEDITATRAGTDAAAKPRRMMFALIGVAVALPIIAAAVTAFLLLGRSNEAGEGAKTPELPAPLIPAERIETLRIPAGGRAEFFSQFQNLVRTGLPENRAIAIPVIATRPDNTEAALGAAEFFTTIEATLPEELLRGLDGRITLGVLPINRENNFFLALGVRQPSRAVAGMLRWEETMLQDLRQLYGARFDTRAGIRTFRDAVLANNNARVLQNTGDKTILR